MANVKDIHHSLIERCRRGDRRAQHELYTLYAKAMFNVSMRIANDYMEAEDVLQEAFVRAFCKLDSFKGDSTFGAWLKRIVINTGINHLRKRRAELVSIDYQTQDVADQGIKTDFGDEKVTWSMDEIRTSISTLPDGYRLVLTLYLIEGYDHGEIGLILGISEATSKSQYSRAKKKLRTILTLQAHERHA